MDSMSRTNARAILLSAVMVLGVAAPAMAGSTAPADASLSVSVSQESSGGATVSVTGTANNTTSAVEGASVTVEVLDSNGSYVGSGTYTTDANGTVSLPAPNQTVNVSVDASAGNRTASTTTTLSGTSTDDGNATAFGERVSGFVSQLQSTNDTSDASLGAMVAAFVLANNPGDPPDHAGPPAWLINDSVDKTTGPPDHAGPPDNTSAGPPDDKGTGE